MNSLIGIQVPVVSLVDEGFEETVDRLNDLGINAIFIGTQAFDRGVQGRQVEYRPWPGHGPKEIDDHRGGAYFTQHAEYYKGTLLGPWRAPDKDVKGVDVLERLISAAKARHTKVYSFILEYTRASRSITKAGSFSRSPGFSSVARAGPSNASQTTCAPRSSR